MRVGDVKIEEKMSEWQRISLEVFQQLGYMVEILCHDNPDGKKANAAYTDYWSCHLESVNNQVNKNIVQKRIEQIKQPSEKKNPQVITLMKNLLETALGMIDVSKKQLSEIDGPEVMNLHNNIVTTINNLALLLKGKKIATKKIWLDAVNQLKEKNTDFKTKFTNNSAFNDGVMDERKKAKEMLDNKDMTISELKVKVAELQQENNKKDMKIKELGGVLQQVLSKLKATPDKLLSAISSVLNRNSELEREVSKLKEEVKNAAEIKPINSNELQQLKLSYLLFRLDGAMYSLNQNQTDKLKAILVNKKITGKHVSDINSTMKALMKVKKEIIEKGLMSDNTMKKKVTLAIKKHSLFNNSFKTDLLQSIDRIKSENDFKRECKEFVKNKALGR